MNATATATILEHMALLGAHPGRAEDNRDYPSDDEIGFTIHATMAELADMMEGTPLEGDISDLLWGQVTLLDGKLRRTAEELSDRQAALREVLNCQDGSEVMSVQLEEHTLIARKLEEHIAAYETMREQAAAYYLQRTGQCWRPRRGSMIRKKTALASVIDAKDLLEAQKAKALAGRIPEGTRIGFAGSPRGGDIRTVERLLDAVRDKHPGMVLMHSGYAKGDDRIAANWAARHAVPQVIVPMDFNRYARRAGFKRNEQMIALKPAGMVILPGNGVTENLRAMAAEAGIRTATARTGAVS